MYQNEGRKSELYMLRGDDIEGFRLKIKRAVRAMQVRMEKEDRIRARNKDDSLLSYNSAGVSSSFLALQAQFEGAERD